MILKATLEMPEQAHRSGNDSRFLIGSQASSPISEAINSPNMNFLLKFRINS